MKKLIPIVVILILLLNGCSKDQDMDTPEWLNEKIETLISDQGLCDITTVTIYTFNDKMYYNIYANIWSCVHCYLYDSDGNLVDLSLEQYDGFNDEKTVVDEFQACE